MIVIANGIEPFLLSVALQHPILKQIIKHGLFFSIEKGHKPLYIFFIPDMNNIA